MVRACGDGDEIRIWTGHLSPPKGVAPPCHDGAVGLECHTVVVSRGDGGEPPGEIDADDLPPPANNGALRRIGRNDAHLDRRAEIAANYEAKTQTQSTFSQDAIHIGLLASVPGVLAPNCSITNNTQPQQTTDQIAKNLSDSGRQVGT
jgi:hypothetical protein